MAKLTKLYGTEPYFYSSEPWNQCLWCDEEYLFVGSQAFGGLSVYKINPDGTLIKKDQILSGQYIKAIWGDEKFIYVAISDEYIEYIPEAINGIQIYKLEIDGTLSLKDTALIDSFTYGYLTGITSDGKFVYATTEYALT